MIGLVDQDGKPPKEETPLPVGRELKKVVGSKPWPPRSERSESGKEDDPKVKDAPRR